MRDNDSLSRYGIACVSAGCGVAAIGEEPSTSNISWELVVVHVPSLGRDSTGLAEDSKAVFSMNFKHNTMS